MFRLQLCVLLGTLLSVESWAIADQPGQKVERLFDPHRLIEVKIEIDEDAWDKVRSPGRSLFEAMQHKQPKSPFKYKKATITIDGIRIENVAIRKKGFLGSLDTERPSLKIRFDKYVKQSPFGDLDRITLNNNKQDPSRLSQYLSYKLFNDSGTVASRCNFAKVFVNGRSLGIYSNVESVKPAMLKRGFGNGTGALFEGTVADIWPKSVDRIEAKNDAANNKDLYALANLLAADALDVAKLESIVDVKAFTKFWATESLIGFWDGYAQNQNNYFMYRHPQNSKLYFMPWGIDSAFTYDIPPMFNKIPYRSMHHNSALANRLCRDPKTRDGYRDAMTKLLADHWIEEQMIADVDRVELLLNDHVEDQEKFELAVEKVRSFIKGRRKRMERELKRWPLKVTIGPRAPTSAEELGDGRLEVDTKWFDIPPSDPLNEGQVTLSLTMNGRKYDFSKVGAYGHPNQDKNVPDVDGKRPPSMTITGKSKKGGTITLILGFDPQAFRPSKSPVKAFGVVFEGSFAWFIAKAVLNPMGLTFVEATTSFDEASMKQGESIRGKMELKVLRFSGGKSEKVKWEE